MSHSKDALIGEVNDFMEQFSLALQQMENLKWFLGDMMVEGKNSMPEDVWQILPASEKVMHTLRQYEICAEKWTEDERNHRLSWFHHWVLRDRFDRKKWIARCIEENTEEYEIRKIIRKEKKKERNDESRNAK